MSQCTILPGPAVHSPYSAEFARHARMAGGTWDRIAKLWRFAGFTTEVVSSICENYYPGKVVVADAIPVPTALPDYGYHGIVGQKTTVKVIVEKAFDYNTRYGSTRVLVMRGIPDSLGAPYRDKIFVWFASSARFDAGATLTLEGTIKAHSARDGISQTVLTRCKKVG